MWNWEYAYAVRRSFRQDSIRHPPEARLKLAPISQRLSFQSSSWVFT